MTDEPARPSWSSGGPRVEATLSWFRQMGFDPEVASEIVTSTARLVAERLASARTLRDVVEATRPTAQIASAAVRNVRAERGKAGLPILQAACARGCAHCCKVHVSISAPEALVLAAFLTDTLDAEALVALRGRLERFAAEVHSLDQAARVRAHLACPLLADGACIAYPVRPLVCAGATSVDARACERALDDPESTIPLEPIVHGAMRAVQLGLATAIATHGLDVGRYELAGALVVALSPGAAERWLAGERIFARSAADSPLDAVATTANAFFGRDPALWTLKKRSPAG